MIEKKMHKMVVAEYEIFFNNSIVWSQLFQMCFTKGFCKSV